MVLEFYYDLLSQPCRAVYLFLKCAGVPFDGVKMQLMKGEHLKEEFLKKNPFHRVPIITDDGYALSESAAILRYIAAKNKLDDHWYPRSDPQKEGRVDEFLHWQQTCIRRQCSIIFLETVRSRIELGRFPKKPIDEANVEAAKKELDRALTHLEDYFLKDRKFIAGDKISAADIIGVCELYQLQGVGKFDALVRSYKKVAEWYDRVTEALQPEYAEAVAAINGMKDMYEKAE